MNLFALVFLFIVTLSLQFNQLLPDAVFAALICCGIAAVFIRAASWRTFVMATLVALLLVQTALRYELSHQPGQQWQGKTITVRGTVEGFTQKRSRGIRFTLLLDNKTRSDAQFSAKRIRIDWFGGPKRTSEDQASDLPQPGQVWELRVKLRQAGANTNPGGFDYSGWLFQRRIHALGYVQKSSTNRVLEQKPAPQARTRLWLADRLVKQGDGASHTGLMQALLVGLREGVPERSNELLRVTGTAHLLAISGLHIGMLAFWGYTLGVALWRLAGKKQGEKRGNQIEFATLLSLLAAAIYAWLAGFTLPTQRALIMLLVVFALRLSRRHSAILTPLSVALLLIVFNDPLAPLSAGFWLSFVSVVILLGIAATGKGVDTRWRQMARSHLLMGIMLFPVTALFFGQASVVAPLANGFAIPFVSFFVVPLLFVWLLLTGIAPEMSAILLQLVEFNLSALLAVLGLLRDWLPAEVTLPQQLDPLQFGSLACALLLALLPQLRQLRVLMLPLVVPFLWAQWLPGGVPGLQMTTLSAGNTPLVVVQQGKQAVVIGLGEFYRNGGNRVRSVLLPFMRSKGIDQVDQLVLPGLSEEYTGSKQRKRQNQFRDRQKQALAHLREQMVVGQVTSIKAGHCAGEWKFGTARLSLQILSALQASPETLSSGYCAVMVHWSAQRLVIITHSAATVTQAPDSAPQSGAKSVAIANTLLVIPGNGGQNPADPIAIQQIIDGLQPDGVVFANGRGGATAKAGSAGFPPEMRQMRYTLRGAETYRTDHDGAVEFSWTTNGDVQVQRFREKGLRPWHKAWQSN